MSAALSHRQPWPTKWIALAIVLVIGPYTYLRWHYRKPRPAFEPYHDLTERANVSRLLSAGFQRITIDADRPAEALRLSAPSAATMPAAGGLPPALATTLVDHPKLPDDILHVTAAASANTMLVYPIEFTCTLPDNHQQPGSARLYVRHEEIVIVPELERLAGDLLSRNRENRIRITLPPGSLKPGHYRATISGVHSSKSWSFDVR